MKRLKKLNSLRPFGLLMAWLIALGSALTSLLAGQLGHMAICNLCWYQRICLYPLAIQLGICAYREDSQFKRYAYPLIGLGGLFALYQYVEQMVPSFAVIGFCGIGPSCTEIPFKWLGFITFPLLSLIAFMLIGLCLYFHRVSSGKFP